MTCWDEVLLLGEPHSGEVAFDLVLESVLLLGSGVQVASTFSLLLPASVGSTGNALACADNPSTRTLSPGLTFFPCYLDS